MTRKLDKEHVDAITDIREAFAENARILGAITIDQKMLELQSKKLEEQQQRYLGEFDELRDREQELMNAMRERYGNGQINIVDGTFTPDSGLAE
jgi:hypothetical protein